MFSKALIHSDILLDSETSKLGDYQFEGKRQLES